MFGVRLLDFIKYHTTVASANMVYIIIITFEKQKVFLKYVSSSITINTSVEGIIIIIIIIIIILLLLYYYHYYYIIVLLLLLLLLKTENH